MERPKFDRRQVLQGGAVLVAGAMLPGGNPAEAQTNRESRERTDRFEEEGLYLNIHAFEKFPGNAL
ncbi:MAG: twin-arginine translocation signal domain-containing protein, partial [Patescibacteria group bacterium]|nr:twin-arginine translocation signal domain-containing protein [Patescibacteria group bacterium]